MAKEKDIIEPITDGTFDDVVNRVVGEPDKSAKTPPQELSTNEEWSVLWACRVVEVQEAAVTVWRISSLKRPFLPMFPKS